MKNKTMTVYFVPITHHDLGYTHVIDELLNVYCQYYDRVLDYCDQTDSYPDEAKYRYTVEQFWSLDYYLKHTTAANIERLKKRIREGRIDLPAFYANIIDCIASDEELIRLMYPSFAFAKECGVMIKRAALTDIPGMSGGIAEILSEAGIKYLFAGFPKYFEWTDATGKIPPMKHTYWDESFGRPAAFHWKAKSGGSVLTWFHSGYGWFGNQKQVCVEINGIDDILMHLPGYLNELKDNGYPYHVMRYLYRGSDNEEPNRDISDMVREWNASHANTGITLTVGTDTMFFEALERECGDVPSLSGELPHTDYTVLSLTEAEMTAKNKIARQKLTIAERLGATNITDVFKDLILYDEHCFGMSVPCGNESEYNRNLKVRYALSALNRADKLLSCISAQRAGEEKKDRIAIFHPAGVKTRGIACFLTQRYEEGFWRLKNLRTGEITYGQSYAVTDPLLPGWEISDAYSSTLCNGGIRRCLFDLSDAEPMSYHTYEVERIDSMAIPEKTSYRFDPDTRGLYDETLDRWITDPLAEYPFGTVLTRDIRDGSVYAATVHTAKKTEDGPVAERYVMRSSVYGAPEVVTEITLYRQIKRIDLAVRLVLDRTPAKEIFLSVPLAIREPRFRYHGVNFVGEAFDPAMEGVNTNHYTTQNWVKVSGDGGEAVLSTVEGGTVYCGGLHTTEVSQAHHMLNPIGFEEPFVKAEDIHDGYLYVLLAYNNCRTNFAMTQQGEVIYRFSLTSGDRVDEWAASEGFVYAPTVLGVDRECPYSHIKLSEPNILLQHIKPAEDGRGYILRLRETDGKTTMFALTTEGETVTEMLRCNLMETDGEVLDPSCLRISPFGILNVRFLSNRSE